MYCPPFFVCAALVLLFSCTSVQESRLLPLDEIEEGDLAFRCGPGVFSRAVTTTEDDGRYSHIGVIVLEDGKWKVVHAVPGETEFKGDFDRVKMEDLDLFFSPERACRGSIVHTGLRDSLQVRSLRRRAIRAARDSVRFDNSYLLEDSTEVYCTEFIWRLYRQSGIDLSEGRRRYVNVLYIKGNVILPEHLYAYSGNVAYYTF